MTRIAIAALLAGLASGPAWAWSPGQRVDPFTCPKMTCAMTLQSPGERGNMVVISIEQVGDDVAKLLSVSDGRPNQCHIVRHKGDDPHSIISYCDLLGGETAFVLKFNSPPSIYSQIQAIDWWPND